MSAVAVLVELPQYAHSFSIEVPPASSVRHLKEQIEQACPGKPRVDGQRLISKGRVLADAEAIERLWKVRVFVALWNIRVLYGAKLCLWCSRTIQRSCIWR